MTNNGKASGGKKAYLFLRWPVVLGLFALALIFFFVGLLNSLGYNGTTELRKVSKNSQEWKNFLSSFSDNPKRGTPFKWKGSQPQTSGDYVSFDKRLIRSLEYLKNKKTCGWDRPHENLTIDVNSPSQWSSYSVPPDKPVPLSTIRRGVGLRIFQADYIKCTEHPRTDRCTEAPTPKKFPDDSTNFPIPLSSAHLLSPNISYDRVHCQVTCGIDYHPLLLDPSDSLPPGYDEKIKSIVKFDPAVPFDYENITPMSRKAGLLKSVLISYELMHIDDPGCETPDGSSGYDKAIPITLILPNWIRAELGDGWDKMIAMAKNQFPFNFQASSPLAALSSDPVLNVLGVHFNY